MTRFFSKALVKWLLKTGAISQQDADVYEYGIYSFLFSLLPFALVLILTVPLGMVTEGFLLIVPFFFLRKFTGGFQSALPCSVTSTLLLLASLAGIKTLLPKPAPPGCFFGYRFHQPQTLFKRAKGVPQNCYWIGLFFRSPFHAADGIRAVSNCRPYRWRDRSYSIATVALFTRRNTKNSKQTVIFS